ncbi:MAG TPA: TetR/AcrR family transcriptional regulator, partial [Actinomycetota bacterium]|nr:TetR/AcrR family transcriptional regulator [Actinomycetota bacterium]
MDASASGERRARRRAPRGQGERLREEILEAAERLLIETGSEDAVSIRA